MSKNQIRITASCQRLIIYNVARPRHSHIFDFPAIQPCLEALTRLRVTLNADYVDIATGYRIPAETRP